MRNFDISEPPAVATMEARIKNIKEIQEKPNWYPEWTIRRFENKADLKAQRKADLEFETLDLYKEDEAIDLFGVPQISNFEHNLLLNEGINELFTILCSASSGTKFDNSNAYIGVGDSNTAEAASQTALQASTNKLYVAMDGSYPTYGTDQKATWRSTYTSANGNFAWNEFTVANGNSDSAKNLNRKVSSQGTKQSGQTWEISLEITMS